MKLKLLSLTFLLFSSILSSQTIDTTLFTEDVIKPVDIKNAGDERLFIAEQAGRIVILNTDGSINPTPFLDIISQVTSGGEQGFLGIAFHPDYITNGFFFVNYIDLDGNTQVSRFSVDDTNPDIADPSSELFIIDYEQPFPEHNAGSLAFDSSGYLYIASGDGGSGGDPGDRAQSLESLLGKILRIDIDNTADGNNYAIPPSNPFVGNPLALDEIWAFGFRNPWRISIDPDTDTIWLGDVGQGAVEEVDRISQSDAGGNYGWRCYEGSSEFNTTGCLPPDFYIFPVTEYEHIGSRCSITGGYVYHGSNMPSFQNHYFYADLCSGIISTLDIATEIATEQGALGASWTAFGVDINQELYIANHFNGRIYKITEEPLSVTDIENNQVLMTPNPASNFVQIQSENSVLDSITILDINGRTLLAINNISSFEELIDINTLSKGLYFVKVSSENGKTSVLKLIIK